MASDAELQEDVIAELRLEATLSCETIGVRAKFGIVTLTGYVESYTRKRHADRAVSRVAGVKALASEIAVRRQGTVIGRSHASDTEMAHATGA
jgi:osmotically-inducible protein OsmY